MLECDAQNAEARNKLDAIAKRKRESANGEYDIIGMIKAVIDNTDRRFDVADYVGPLARKCENEADGLIATRDIQPGTLLACVKAFECVYLTDLTDTVSKSADGFSADADVDNTIVRFAALANRVIRHLLYVDPTAMRAFFDLPCRSALKSIRCETSAMSSTRGDDEKGREVIKLKKAAFPHSVSVDANDNITDAVGEIVHVNFPGDQHIQAETDLPIDVNDVLAILERNGLDQGQITIDRFDNHAERCSDEKTGIWPLATRFRHSCVANAAGLRVGDVVIIRAVRSIKQGDELKAAYSSTHTPMSLAQRRVYFKSIFGAEFECKCELCRLDEAVSVNSNLMELFGAQLTGDVNSLLSTIAEMERTYADAKRTSLHCQLYPFMMGCASVLTGRDELAKAVHYGKRAFVSLSNIHFDEHPDSVSLPDSVFE